MAGSEWLAAVATLMCAISILPGTLGILMWTNRFAAQASGARLIYQRSQLLFALSLLGMIISWVWALRGDTVPPIVIGSSILFAGVLGFGFLMHTRLLFQPVLKPRFISIEQALKEFDGSEEVVGVIDPDNRPWAFIARLARRPHIVHQPEGSAPFMMTHCILSHSSMAYENSGAFNQPEIMITAAIANNMVFYDRKNRCSITQLHNASADGSLSLKTLPTIMMSLTSWALLYPQSSVWIRPKTWRDIFYLKVLSRAEVIDPASPVLIYPLMNGTDDRLSLKQLVLGVEVNGEERAYPMAALGSDTVINDELGATPVLVVTAFDGDYAQVFSREVEPGRVLTFGRKDNTDQFTDQETQSVWSLDGNCTRGTLQGSRLRPIPHYNKIFWFAWADYHPGTDVYTMARVDKNRGQAA